MLFHPYKTALLGIAVWLILWLIAPLEAFVELNKAAMGFMALCYAAFFVGCALCIRFTAPRALKSGTPQSRRTRSGLFWSTGALGALGMALRLYDRVVLRSVDLSLTALEQREAIGQVEAGAVAAIGGALMPFCFIPLVLLLAGGVQRGKLLLWLIAGAIFALPMLEALTILSRSSMLITGSMAFFAVACTRFNGEIFHRKLVLPAAALVIALVIISTTIFTSRLNEAGSAVGLSVANSGYAYTLRPTATGVGSIRSRVGAESAAYTIALPNLMYYLHGVYEFTVLWERPDPQPHGFGLQHFYPYVKLATLFGLNVNDDFLKQRFQYRAGVWTSFFGPLWTDFGVFSALFMMCFGYGAQFVALMSKHGHVSLIPLNIFFSVVIFFIPVVNFFVSGQGMYIVNAFIIFGIVGSWLQRSSPRKKEGASEARTARI